MNAYFYASLSILLLVCILFFFPNKESGDAHNISVELKLIKPNTVNDSCSNTHKDICEILSKQSIRINPEVYNAEVAIDTVNFSPQGYALLHEIALRNDRIKLITNIIRTTSQSGDLKTVYNMPDGNAISKQSLISMNDTFTLYGTTSNKEHTVPVISGKGEKNFASFPFYIPVQKKTSICTVYEFKFRNKIYNTILLDWYCNGKQCIRKFVLLLNKEQSRTDALLLEFDETSFLNYNNLFWAENRENGSLSFATQSHTDMFLHNEYNGKYIFYEELSIINLGYDIPSITPNSFMARPLVNFFTCSEVESEANKSYLIVPNNYSK